MKEVTAFEFRANCVVDQEYDLMVELQSDGRKIWTAIGRKHPHLAVVLNRTQVQTLANHLNQWLEETKDNE